MYATDPPAEPVLHKKFRLDCNPGDGTGSQQSPILLHEDISDNELNATDDYNSCFTIGLPILNSSQAPAYSQRRRLDPEVLSRETLILFHREDKKGRYIRCETCFSAPHFVRRMNYRNRLPAIATPEGTEYRTPVVLDHVNHRCHIEAMRLSGSESAFATGAAMYNTADSESFLPQIKIIQSSSADYGSIESPKHQEINSTHVEKVESSKGYECDGQSSHATEGSSEVVKQNSGSVSIRFARHLVTLAYTLVKLNLKASLWSSMVLLPDLVSAKNKPDIKHEFSDCKPASIFPTDDKWTEFATSAAFIGLLDSVVQVNHETILQTLEGSISSALCIQTLSTELTSSKRYHVFLRVVTSSSEDHSFFLGVTESVHPEAVIACLTRRQPRYSFQGTTPNDHTILNKICALVFDEFSAETWKLYQEEFSVQLDCIKHPRWLVCSKLHRLQDIWNLLRDQFPSFRVILDNLYNLMSWGCSHDWSGFSDITLQNPLNINHSTFTQYLNTLLTQTLSSLRKLFQSKDCPFAPFWRNLHNIRLACFLADLAHVIGRYQRPFLSVNSTKAGAPISWLELKRRAVGFTRDINELSKENQLGGWEEELVTHVDYTQEMVSFAGEELDTVGADKFVTIRADILLFCENMFSQSVVVQPITNCNEAAAYSDDVVSAASAILPMTLAQATGSELRSAHKILCPEINLRDFVDASKEAIQVIRFDNSLSEALRALCLRSDSNLFQPLVLAYSRLIVASPIVSTSDWFTSYYSSSNHSELASLGNSMESNWLRITINMPAVSVFCPEKAAADWLKYNYPIPSDMDDTDSNIKQSCILLQKDSWTLPDLTALVPERKVPVKL